MVSKKPFADTAAVDGTIATTTAAKAATTTTTAPAPAVGYTVGNSQSVASAPFEDDESEDEEAALLGNSNSNGNSNGKRNKNNNATSYRNGTSAQPSTTDTFASPSPPAATEHDMMPPPYSEFADDGNVSLDPQHVVNNVLGSTVNFGQPVFPSFDPSAPAAAVNHNMQTSQPHSGSSSNSNTGAYHPNHPVYQPGVTNELPMGDKILSLWDSAANQFRRVIANRVLIDANERASRFRQLPVFNMPPPPNAPMPPMPPPPPPVPVPHSVSGMHMVPPHPPHPPMPPHPPQRHGTGPNVITVDVNSLHSNQHSNRNSNQQSRQHRHSIYLGRRKRNKSCCSACISRLCRGMCCCVFLCFILLVFLTLFSGYALYEIIRPIFNPPLDMCEFVTSRNSSIVLPSLNFNQFTVAHKGNMYNKINFVTDYSLTKSAYVDINVFASSQYALDKAVLQQSYNSDKNDFDIGVHTGFMFPITAHCVLANLTVRVPPSGLQAKLVALATVASNVNIGGEERVPRGLAKPIIKADKLALAGMYGDYTVNNVEAGQLSLALVQSKIKGSAHVTKVFDGDSSIDTGFARENGTRIFGSMLGSELNINVTSNFCGSFESEGGRFTVVSDSPFSKSKVYVDGTKPGRISGWFGPRREVGNQRIEFSGGFSVTNLTFVDPHH
ncbi:hypothetical protein GQ42DRAFT_177700 [Ramicandelaber brevisporus]|nr:hypothetical protein GQ42DRAFT_177700 [Ramicandelaber brevisporus]